MRHGDREGVVDESSARRRKSNHRTIAWLLRILVVWFADEEQRPRARIRLPACPRPTAIAESRFYGKRGHQWVVESQGSIEITDANKDVREHAVAFKLWFQVRPTQTGRSRPAAPDREGTVRGYSSLVGTFSQTLMTCGLLVSSQMSAHPSARTTTSGPRSRLLSILNRLPARRCSFAAARFLESS